MEESIRAVPDAAVQETSFEDDTPTRQNDDAAARPPPKAPKGQRSGPIEAAASYGSNAGPSHYGHNHDPGQPSHFTGPTRSTTRALGPDLLRGLVMALMALDHNSIISTRSPSTVLDSGGGERDTGVTLHTWSPAGSYAIRLLVHLCAPGFVFLFGMGIVYFGQSRRALGWSASRMVWHLFTRAVVLTVVTVLLGLVLTLGRVWFFNAVLFAVAVDYLLAGLLWLVMVRTEEMMAFWLLRVLPDSKKDDAREPLLADRRGEEGIAPDRKIMRAADISWHVHNTVLLILAVVTIWWNIWLSPTGGQCNPTAVTSALPASNWSRIWFHVVLNEHIYSLYPPLAWLSFALLGLLYGRIAIARTWTRTTLSLGNMVAGLAFLLVFVLTRVLHLGNLSEHCLRMPEHRAHPDSNQYLASPQSFFYLVAYPPDVAFWAYGTGSNLMLLGILGGLPTAVAGTVLQPLVAYGTSPLFFYTTHLLLLGASRLFWFSVWGLPIEKDPWAGNDRRGVDSEWVFWLNWVVILVIMYPLCRWYGAFKRTKAPNSLWRFF